MSFTVYRVVDDQDRTIYIGQTGNFPERRKQQLRSLAGADEVYPISEHETREEARAAEALLIDKERPQRNWQHNPVQGQPETPYAKVERLSKQLAEARVVMKAVAAALEVAAQEMRP